MRPLILCFYVLITGTTCAQVSGRVADPMGRPVPFATAALIRSTDSVVSNSVAVNATGSFSMDGVQPGNYFLRITAVGYQTCLSAVFAVSQGQQADLGGLVMRETDKTLSEVVVHAKRPPVQQTAEGITVSVQNSIMAQGSSILDVLQRSPGVIVDQHNNTLSLNGKTGVMVMMDGRLLRMSMDQLITLLGSLSADNIDKIELMNTPPARYDAEGNAGIINIVTKRNKKRGTNGSITLTGGYGMYEKASAGLNIDHHIGKCNLYGSFAYRHDHDYGGLYATGTENAEIVGGQGTFSYTGLSRPVSNNIDCTLGADIKPDTSTTIGASASYLGGVNSNPPHNYGYYLFGNAPALTYSSYFTNSGHLDNLITNMYLDKDLHRGRKIRTDLDYLYYHTLSVSNSQSSFTDAQGNPAGNGDSLYSPTQRDFGNTLIRALIGKGDYSASLTGKVKLEGGVKATYTRTTARSGIENSENGVWVPDIVGSASNFITYESIDAGYLTFHIRFDSATSLVAGARYEYSHNYSDKSTDSNYLVNRKLGRLFPSMSFLRKLNDHSSWQASYTERITRPGFSDLASYIAYNDPLSVFTGNPLLKPAITRNLKFGYNDHDYLFSILFSRDDDPILGTQITTGPVKGVGYLRPENGDWQNSVTLQATLPLKINDWWDMHYTLTGGWRQYRISFTPEPLEKTFFAGSFNFSENFTWQDGLSAELSGYYNSPSYSANWRSYGNIIVNLGVKKAFGEGKGSVKLSVADILRGASYRSDVGFLTTDAFNSKVHVHYDAESGLATIVKLSYYRTFGSTGAKNREKRDSGSGEERSRL